MKLTFIFFKRNLKEIFRDPIVYIFCILFPSLMILLFAIINHFSKIQLFEMKELIPGILIFSYSFVMLSITITISKDIHSFFLKRLYISPMKTRNFIFGYSLIAINIGIIQAFITMLLGYIVSLFVKEDYFSFSSSILLFLSSLPYLIFSIFIGLFISSIFSEKASPAITSIFISLSGILSGCYIPLEDMGSFEIFCRYLPFYPEVKIGRLITNSISFSNDYYIDLLVIFIYMFISIFLGVFFFNRQTRTDK